MKTIFENRRGFSLVELIITVTLIFVIVSLGYLIISAGNSNFDQGTAKAHLQSNTRLLDEYIQNNVRKATNILVTVDEGLQLDNNITVLDNVAKANDTSITASVIDDIQIKVDDNGDRPIIEYIISASGDGETFELTNSMVMNNLPPSYFAGNYSSFTSIGSAAISFNNDMIIPLTRSLSWHDSPGELVRGTIYSGEETKSLNIYVENDVFNEALGVIDASLSGGIGNLQIIEILKVNDEQISLVLGNGTVTDIIGTGTITIRESAFQIGGDLTIEVEIVNPDILYIEVSGQANILIPKEGKAPVSEAYIMTAYDVNDGPIAGEEATWSIVGTIPQGVSLNAVSGVLEITDIADIGVVTIKAQSITNTEMTDTYDITLEEDTSPSLQDIMDGIETLPFRGDWDAYDRPSYVTIPASEYEGLTFELTAVTGYIDLVPPDAIIKRSNSSNENGTITLTGTMDGVSIDIIFDVYIPIKVNKNKEQLPIEIVPAD